jgi:hypothetical protein
VKIKDVFEPNGKGTVRAKQTVTVRTASGDSATFRTGLDMDARSAAGIGLSPQWILDHLNSDVPPTWFTPEQIEDIERVVQCIGKKKAIELCQLAAKPSATGISQEAFDELRAFVDNSQRSNLHLRRTLDLLKRYCSTMV